MSNQIRSGFSLALQQLASKSLVTLACLGLLGGAGLAAAADSAQKQIETAAQHAKFAAAGNQASAAALHLHHVINCLVGPNGDGFDAKAGDPCKGQGNGALNDLQGSPGKKAMLEQALALAKVGVQIQAAGPCTTTAKAVQELLMEAAKSQ